MVVEMMHRPSVGSGELIRRRDVVDSIVKL